MKLSKEQTKEYIQTYKTYYSLIFNIIYSKIEKVHEADDICQEIFIRLYKRFDEVENYRKWLYGTLRNVIKEYYKGKRDNTIDIDSLFDDISISYVNGFRDIRLILEEALENEGNYETPKERVLFELITVYNYSYGEVCKHLNMSYMQVRYTLKKILNRMQAYLQEKGIKSLEELL